MTLRNDGSACVCRVTASILLRGDAAETVAQLKKQPGDDLAIVGSASLVRTLHAAGPLTGATRTEGLLLVSVCSYSAR